MNVEEKALSGNTFNIKYNIMKHFNIFKSKDGQIFSYFIWPFTIYYLKIIINSLIL